MWGYRFPPIERTQGPALEEARAAAEKHRQTYFHLADQLAEYNAALIENALVLDVGAFAVGDDFGNQQALMLSPKT